MITIEIKGQETRICDDSSKFKFKLDEDKQEVVCIYNSKEIGFVKNILSNENFTDEELVKNYLDIGQDIL